MRRIHLPTWAFAPIGAATYLLLQWYVARHWSSYYSHFPHRGYEKAMAAGNIPASLFASARSLVHVLVATFLVALATLPFRSGKLRHATLALWAGMLVGSIAIVLSTPRLREDLSMWPVDLVFVGAQIATPLFVAAVLVAAVRRRPSSQRSDATLM